MGKSGRQDRVREEEGRIISKKVIRLKKSIKNRRGGGGGK